MKSIYTKAYLKNTLHSLGDIAEELNAWDVYNGDILQEALVKLNDARFLLSKIVEEVDA